MLEIDKDPDAIRLELHESNKTRAKIKNFKYAKTKFSK